MKEYKFTCQYCNNSWTKTFYYSIIDEDFSCEVCKDPNISIREIKKADKNYYGNNRTKEDFDTNRD